MLFLIVILLCFHISRLSTISTTKNKDYGPFDLKVLSCDIQPNKQYEKIIKVNNVECHVRDGVISSCVNMTISKNMGYLGISIKAYRWQEKSKKYILAVNTKAKNVCKDSFMQMFTVWITNLDKDCRIAPKTYAIAISNANAFIQTITHGVFFYGTYVVITDMMVSGHGRVLRSNATGVLTPKRPLESIDRQ